MVLRQQRDKEQLALLGGGAESGDPQAKPDRYRTVPRATD